MVQASCSQNSTVKSSYLVGVCAYDMKNNQNSLLTIAHESAQDTTQYAR